MAWEFLGDGGAMLAPLAGEEVVPVGGGGHFFAFGIAELEEDGKAAFAEAGVGFQCPAVLQLYLCFWGASEVGDFRGALV